MAFASFYLPFELALGIGLAALSAQAIGSTYQCPERIETSQVLSGTYPGWQPGGGAATAGTALKSAHFLAGVSFSDGPPQERMVLRPQQESASKNGKFSTTWSFIKTRRVWLSCEYRSTTVTLAQPLDTNAKQCTVSYDRREAINVQAIECR